MKTFHIATAFSVAALAAGGANAQDWKIAFFAASSQNGFNQATYAGIEEKAAELGVETARAFFIKVDPVQFGTSPMYVGF